METAHAAYSAARLIAMLGSIAVWLFGTIVTSYILVWFISSPAGELSPEASPVAILAVTGIALADVLLCIAATRPSGVATLRFSVLAVFILAVAAPLSRPVEAFGTSGGAFVMMSLLVPSLAFALVLPTGILGWRDPSAATTAMAGIGVAFLTAFLGQALSNARLWISIADLGGALATGVLVALLLGARIAKTRTSTTAAESLETTAPGGFARP